MASSNDIRATFLDYFAANAHQVVESSSLVPRNDPTLLFTAAGMVQFKNVFTGQETRPYVRATSAQKCLRAGGKHNDLDNVGYTARHHTFFEMLGNFSFGDYFKEQAIHHAWTLITREFRLPPEKLLVTVYSEDEQAADLWRRIAGLSDDRIIRIASSDNFWRMADTGPCGPCSEIFYDHGDHVAGGPPGSATEDGDRFIEIWNLVFMQYNEGPPGTRVDLPRPSIDTGMGLERLAAILQGKHDNYDIDTFRALILASAEITGQEPDGPFKVSHRVLADHVRSSAFLMADGVLPSNEGRGYVLRRIMRRAMRHAHMMGAREPVMDRLVPALTRQMGAAYPELIAAEPLIRETLRLEETRFASLLERGMSLLSNELSRLGQSQTTLPGDIAFRLYDTYGFPLDLTQDVLREQGHNVDLAGFNTAMSEQRRRARAAWSGSGEAGPEAVWFELREKLGGTEFLGYTSEVAEAEITALVVGGMLVNSVEAGEQVQLLLNQTPFYAESGGQVGDTGTISGPDNLVIIITDTQKKPGNLFAHIGRVETGTAQLGAPVRAEIDHVRRAAIQAHHSATHLLHAALRDRLGPHVAQKGSLNAPDRLRFDVSQPRPITAQELAQVEFDVNAQIRANTRVTTRLMTPEAAVAEGAMALFGEKYGDEVRVVSMGTPSGNHAYSVELCGGTHIPATGHIGLFRIIAESAVAAGIRRIEAVTGQAALAQIAETEARLGEIAQALKSSPADAPARVQSLVEDRKRLERQVAELQTKLALTAADGAVEQIAGTQLIARNLGDVPPRELKTIAEALRKQLGSGIVALVSTADGKASLIVAVTNDLAGRFDAVALVRAGSGAVGGKGGGGKPDLAQAGGPDGSAADAALDAIRTNLAL